MPHEADGVDLIVVAPGRKPQELRAEIGEPQRPASLRNGRQLAADLGIVQVISSAIFFRTRTLIKMPAPTPNPRGAEFWNSTMGHAWVSQQAVISDVFTSVTSVSLGAAAAKQGEHVIDIGCGTGDTLLAFAKSVGPSGAVLGVDVSVPMLDFAKHRAADAGLGNVTCALGRRDDIRLRTALGGSRVFAIWRDVLR